MKTSITQIWMVCHLLPFAKVGQHSPHMQEMAVCLLYGFRMRSVHERSYGRREQKNQSKTPTPSRAHLSTFLGSHWLIM